MEVLSFDNHHAAQAVLHPLLRTEQLLSQAPYGLLGLRMEAKQAERRATFTLWLRKCHKVL